MNRSRADAAGASPRCWNGPWRWRMRVDNPYGFLYITGAVPILDELSDLGDPCLRWSGAMGSKAETKVCGHGGHRLGVDDKPCSHARILRTDAP